MNRQVKEKSRLGTEKGAILFLFVILTTFLLGVTGLSVDVGRIFLVRTELKRAATSASLAGAGYLYPTASNGQPNWSLAQEKALQAISWNHANGVPLVSGEIETGYWDLTGENPGIRSPSAVPNPGEDDLPAVKVTISMSPGENNGPLPLYFGSIVGVPSKAIAASSVAGAGSPRTVDAGTLFPVLVPLSIYEEYWDFNSQTPKTDPSTGEAFVFEIKAKDKGVHGQWTSFEKNINNVPYVRELIKSGNPTPLSIGQMIHVVPGIKTALYNNVPSNIDVGIAILSDSETGGQREIVGFGALHIHYATGKNKKSLTVSLLENHKVPGGSPGGKYYGAYVPPKLTQ